MYLSFLFSFERSCGALAQLGERLLCTQEVSGSIPLSSTIMLRRFTQVRLKGSVLKTDRG